MINENITHKGYPDDIHESFPPICPVCGNRMTWNSSYDMCESNYIAEDEDYDGIINFCVCGQCNTSAEFESTADGDVLLSTAQDIDETGDAIKVTYSQYAKDKYGMTDYDTSEY